MGGFDVGQVLLGKLRVVRLLGEGGMGAVYEVEHLLTKHRRALKVLHVHLADSGQAVSRFVREAGLAGHLESRHLVAVHDAGQLEDGSPYVLMDLLEGAPLLDLLDGGPLPVGTAAHIVREVALGMDEAHEAGVIHRDLKPANLFIESVDGEASVKIIDFGVSKFTHAELDGELTKDGALLGTPYYMAPEQMESVSDVDRRVDVYSLGVILYEALSGTLPFSAPSMPALMARVHLGEHEPLARLAPGLDPGLVAVVERAMAYDREDRYATMGELAEALRPWARWDGSQTMPGARREVSELAETVAATGLTVEGAATVADGPSGGPLTREALDAVGGLSRASGRRLGWIAGAVALVGAAIGIGVTTTSQPADAPASIREEPGPAAGPALAPTTPVEAPVHEADAGATIDRAEVEALPSGRDAPAPATTAQRTNEAVDEAPAMEAGTRYRRAQEAGLRTDNPYGDP